MSEITRSGGGRAESKSVVISTSLRERNEGAVFGTNVIRARTDDFVIDPLLDYVCAPPGGARQNEQWREHWRWPPHQMIRNRAVPIEIGEHLLFVPHHRFDSLGDVEQIHRRSILRQLSRDVLDDAVARVGNGVNR